ncbi:MAG: hypothetical protein ACLQNE_42625, partial [Thermoguttaceae bacterium]
MLGRTCWTILFRAEVREVIRAEGPAVHPAKGLPRPLDPGHDAQQAGGAENLARGGEAAHQGAGDAHARRIAAGK